MMVSATTKPQQLHYHKPFMHKTQECMFSLMPEVN